MLIGGSQALVVTLSAVVIRRRYNRWGATDAEVASGMPGDDLVPDPQLGYTRAITIQAPPDRVWPWLVQIGHGRGGLYSFDGLENLLGCQIHSADTVLADFQDLQPGDLIRMGPAGYPCFRVNQLQPAGCLVLVGADPQPPHAAATAESATGMAAWQWQLLATADGSATRLIVRQRLAYPRRLAALWHVVEPVAFVMERQMLLGLRDRAERS